MRIGIFPGQYYDAETGLHYNWNRYYDPGTGRYLRTDPIGIDGGMNLFLYANANPVNLIDPEGKYVEVGTRYFYPVPLHILGFSPYHCFVRFNGNNSDTLSFDKEGTHSDPVASKDSWLLNFFYNVTYDDVEPKCDTKDSCVRESMRKCKDFNIVNSNCCDCARKSLNECDLQKEGSWPNFGI